MDDSRLQIVTRLLVLSLCAFALACDEDKPEPVESVDIQPADDRIQTLEGVDTEALPASARRVFVREVNDLLSPCGEPVSVARCVAESRGCGKCIVAARYLARLAGDGLDRTELREFYRLRFGRDSEVSIDVEGAPVRGAVMAPIRIVEFSDFECPFCGRAAPELERIIGQFPGEVQLVFKHFPLSMHEHAGDAALATNAAGRQNKFWEMHDVLFENQTELTPSDLERYGQELGLDMDQYRADLQSEELRAAVERDKAQGMELGVDSTPTIFVGNRRFAEPIENLPAYLREELEMAR